jgi:hypothetical protein
MENLHKGFVVKREVDIVVSPQALLILQHTGFTKEEFVDWVIKTKQIAFGGGDVVNFLEFKEVKQDGTTTTG